MTEVSTDVAIPYGSAATPVLERTGTDTRWHADADVERYRSPDLMLSDKMPTLVKGAGYARVGGNMPLSDDEAIFRRSMKAEDAFRAAIAKGINEPREVLKGLKPEFAGQFAAFMTAAPQNQGLRQLATQFASALKGVPGVDQDVLKSITTTSPLGTGFVPFDLVAPSSLIYPVYSPLRNKLPRVPGQGASRRRKVITGVSGSQTGPSGGKFVRLGIPELVQSGGAIGGTSSAVNWPLNLPGTGTQDAVDLTVPYRFWGLSENLSWLSQFEGWLN